jgi:hypothetical protein
VGLGPAHGDEQKGGQLRVMDGLHDAHIMVQAREESQSPSGGSVRPICTAPAPFLFAHRRLCLSCPSRSDLFPRLNAAVALVPAAGTRGPCRLWPTQRRGGKICTWEVVMKILVEVPEG